MKNGLFISNLKYHGIYVRPESTKATIISVTNTDEIEEIVKDKDINLDLYLVINISGFKNIESVKNTDGISILSYTKFDEGILRFDDMRASKINADEENQKEFTFKINDSIKYENNGTYYIKILYLPDVFGETKYNDPFNLMEPNNELELINLKFPAFYIKEELE